MPDIPPVRNLPDGAEPWGRYIEGAVSSLQSSIDLLAQRTGNSDNALNASYDNLAKQITQLNSNVSVESVLQLYGGDELTGVGQDVALVTMVRPEWAFRCVVLAISVVTTNTTNQISTPLSGTMLTRIDGVNSGTYTINTTADSVYTTKTVPFNRNFPVSSDVVVSTRVSTYGGGVNNALSAQLAVTALWFPA